jgi:hypothetical protein
MLDAMVFKYQMMVEIVTIEIGGVAPDGDVSAWRIRRAFGSDLCRVGSGLLT